MVKHNQNLNNLISEYTKVYKAFEELQDGEVLPGGDQKTGVIGEYYAKCFAENIALSNTAKYAKPGKVYNLKYLDKQTGEKVKVQVKCVSDHSKTRTIAPLNLEHIDGKRPFDLLYLIALNKEFKPYGFYINSYEDILLRVIEKRGEKHPPKIVGTKMKGNNSEGSGIYDFKDNRVNELIKILGIQ